MRRQTTEAVLLSALWLVVFTALLAGLGTNTLTHTLAYTLLLVLLAGLLDERWSRTPKPVGLFLAESPLVAFSVYTHIQADETRRLGRDVLTTLDDAITLDRSGGTVVDATLINRAYGQFWLWVLGAYEVVRTMDQAKGCLRTPLADNVSTFKRHIAGLRIPFAKQEYATKSKTPNAIEAAASIAGIDGKARDMLFEVRGTDFWARQLVTAFADLIQSIKREDILHRHGWRPPTQA